MSEMNIEEQALFIAERGLSPIEDGPYILKLLDQMTQWVDWSRMDATAGETLCQALLRAVDSQYNWVGRSNYWEDWFYEAFAQLYVIHKKGRSS